jgi:hypothetical protein
MQNHGQGLAVVYIAKDMLATDILQLTGVLLPARAAWSQACCGECSGISPRVAEQITTVLQLDFPCILNI